MFHYSSLLKQTCRFLFSTPSQMESWKETGNEAMPAEKPKNLEERSASKTEDHVKIKLPGYNMEMSASSAPVLYIEPGQAQNGSGTNPKSCT